MYYSLHSKSTYLPLTLQHLSSDIEDTLYNDQWLAQKQRC